MDDDTTDGGRPAGRLLALALMGCVGAVSALPAAAQTGVPAPQPAQPQLQSQQPQPQPQQAQPQTQPQPQQPQSQPQ